MTNMYPVGAHLAVSRGLYSHHGIHVGDGYVVHFSGGLGPKNKLNALIRRDRLQVFADGGQIRIIRHNTNLSGYDIAQRALSRLGESGYDLFENNCEHLVNWCIAGKPVSAQAQVAGFGLAALMLFGLAKLFGSGSGDEG